MREDGGSDRSLQKRSLKQLVHMTSPPVGKRKVQKISFKKRSSEPDNGREQDEFGLDGTRARETRRAKSTRKSHLAA